MITSIQYFLILLFSFTILSAQTVVPDEWKTLCEKTSYKETSSYAGSMEYFKKLADNSPYAKFVKFGNSPQGRDLMLLIVSKEGAFDPVSAKETRKPIILIENGIHAGEIEGKDASMIMLREMLITKEKEYLLDNVILLVIPIFSVDSHERTSPYNRINQNGPTNMGWRTTSTNYNLNRDFVKADAPEMRAWLKMYNEWIPDFFIDCHTTDGLDLQYTVTYTVEKFRNIPPATSKWVTEEYEPFMKRKVEEQGYLMAPYIWFKNYNMTDGLLDYVTPPMLSTGYVGLQSRPGLLIETHSLKPYKERVHATQAILESSLELFNKQYEELVSLNNSADMWNIENYLEKKKFFPVLFDYSPEIDSFLFKGIKWNETESWITGTPVKEYNGEPFEITIPHIHQSVVTDSVKVPFAYLIPQEWKKVVEVLDLHGIEHEVLKTNEILDVARKKFANVKFDAMPYDGRFKPAFEIINYQENVEVPEGTIIVKTNQRRLPLIMYLLEPISDDSFVKWGFFNTIFVRTEYFELYSMLPVANEMVKVNPELKTEFLKWLKEHPEVESNPRDRMRWFYEKSPYYDETHNVYPVLRVEEKF
ncbi:MAG: carboxypeptidase [Bacteroidetes bacterium]|nr:carboxypeptidase [Bacteroidota bacterium]